jgi:predicted metalloprotease with PDZ domain
MSLHSRSRGMAISAFLVLFALAARAQGPAHRKLEGKPIVVSYMITVDDARNHRLSVDIYLWPGLSERTLYLPVWNALYQVRDFSQYVQNLHVETDGGRRATIRATGTSKWVISGAENGAWIKYEFVANLPPPFGTVADAHHVFINPAELLMYTQEARQGPVAVCVGFGDKEWGLATALSKNVAGGATRDGPATACMEVGNYDQLADSPIEIGDFKEASFDEGGGHYRIVVDGDPADYDMQKLVEQNRKIVRAETAWMQDRPFEHYLFIYHFPRGPAGGGMEHAYSTAISMTVRRLQADPNASADVTAHEFFHLWNVKRIRPQCLEPVDYTQEQYCDALWFAEGGTSTVSELILLRTGFIDAEHYLNGVAKEIEELQSRPAHKWMSAEESSIETWYDKYPTYRTPQRSISYYNKGFILGVLLDLQMREATGGKKSLRDLFIYLNQNFAKQGKSYANSDGIRRAVEALTGADLRGFWEHYVAGRDEIPYDDFFRTVGLHLETTEHAVADPGFTAVRTFGTAGAAAVSEVADGSGAASAGLQEGDAIVSVEGQQGVSLESAVAAMNPGDILRLTINRNGRTQELRIKLGSRTEARYRLVDLPKVTAQQRTRRNEWLFGASTAP